jgi:hypothetical protein
VGEKEMGRGKGAESKKYGSLAIATSEQAEGWDVTRKVSFSFFFLSVSFYLEVFFLRIHRFYILLMSNVLARSVVFFFWRICSVFGEGPSNPDGEPLAEVLAYMH